MKPNKKINLFKAQIAAVEMEKKAEEQVTQMMKIILLAKSLKE